MGYICINCYIWWGSMHYSFGCSCAVSA